jgi:hypothetical protein
VKRSAERDRRLHARFPQALDVCAKSMPPVNASYAASREFQGRLQNVSQGGICMMSSQPLPVATFCSCEISMPDIPVSIPALMQVQWTSKRGRDAHHYISGLRFVSGS